MIARIINITNEEAGVIYQNLRITQTKPLIVLVIMPKPNPITNNIVLCVVPENIDTPQRVLFWFDPLTALRSWL